MYDPDHYGDDEEDCRWLAACGISIFFVAILGGFLWLFVESQGLTAWECRPETPTSTVPKP